MQILAHTYFSIVHRKMCPRGPLPYNAVKLILETLMSDSYAIFAMNLVFRTHITLMHRVSPQELLQPILCTYFSMHRKMCPRGL